VQSGQLRLIVVLGGLSAFGPLSLDLYLPGLPALARDLGAPASAAQLTLTACLAGLALGQLVAGPLSDRYGRRRPLLAGVALYALTSLLCAAAPSIAVLVVLRLAQGLAGAAGIVIARAVVRDRLEGDAAARLFSSLMLVGGIAPILAPIVGAQLLKVLDWRGIFVVLAGAGLALLAAALALPESLPPERRRSGGLATVARTVRSLAADPGFLSYALCGGFVLGAMFAYIAGSPFVLQDIYGLSPQAFSLAFAVNGLGIMAAASVNRRLVGRLRPATLLRAGVTQSALGGVLLLTAVLTGAGGRWGVLAALFLVVSCVGLVGPNTIALALARHGEVAGTASALLGVIQFLIGAVAAPLVGIAGDDTAVPMAVTIVVLALGAVAAERWGRAHTLRG
jgi:MFS transporter, DHA1 family, multidrug resistance protein